MPLKTSSAKDKGRRLQQWVVEQLLKWSTLKEDDVTSRSMGARGEDILMSPAARRIYPFSIECKNVEKLNVWEAYEQAGANAKGHEPIVVIKKNYAKPLVVLDAEYFFALCMNFAKRLDKKTLKG